MENTNDLTALINKTTDDILDGWTRSAALAGIDAEDYIDLKLDEMVETDWETCKVIMARKMRRTLAAEGLVTL